MQTPSSQQFHSYSAPALPSFLAQKQISSMSPEIGQKQKTLPVSQNGIERKQIPQHLKIGQTQIPLSASTNGKVQKQASPLPKVGQKQLSSTPTNCHQLLPSCKNSNFQQCHSYSNSSTSVGAAISLLDNFEGISETMLEIEAVVVQSGDTENDCDESQSKSEQQCTRLPESKSNFNLINIYFSKKKL